MAYFFTNRSESVSEGHYPDKVADQTFSDASSLLLDNFLAQDKDSECIASRTETLVTTGLTVLSGEVT